LILPNIRYYKNKLFCVIFCKITIVKIAEIEIKNGLKGEEKFNLCEVRIVFLRGSFVLKFNNAKDLEIIYATDEKLHIFSMCIFLL